MDTHWMLELRTINLTLLYFPFFSFSLFPFILVFIFILDLNKEV